MLPSKRGYDHAFDIAVGFKGGFERRRLAGQMLSVFCLEQRSPLHSNASIASPPIENARIPVGRIVEQLSKIPFFAAVAFYK